MEPEQPTLRVAWLWAAYAVVCAFLILGVLMYEEGSLRGLTVAFLGIGGALSSSRSGSSVRTTRRRGSPAGSGGGCCS